MPFGIEVISVKPRQSALRYGTKRLPQKDPFNDGLYRDALRRFYDLLFEEDVKDSPDRDR